MEIILFQKNVENPKKSCLIVAEKEEGNQL